MRYEAKLEPVLERYWWVVDHNGPPMPGLTTHDLVHANWTEPEAKIIAFALNTIANGRLLASVGPNLRDSTATPVGCADIREYHGPIEGVV